jgi:hypothetical protein
MLDLFLCTLYSNENYTCAFLYALFFCKNLDSIIFHSCIKQKNISHVSLAKGYQQGCRHEELDKRTVLSEPT